MARKKFTASFKAQVALEALTNKATLAELSKKYDVHPTQIKDLESSIGITGRKYIFRKKQGHRGQQRVY